MPGSIVPRSLAVALDVDPGPPLDRVRRRRCSVEPQVGERVAADARSCSPGLRLPSVVVAKRADPDRADHEQDDRRVDDVAAVAAPVPPDEARRTRRARSPTDRLPRARAARELEHDRREHERRERVADRARPGSIPAPSASSSEPGASAAAAGPATARPSAWSDARRQATSGPMPMSRTSGSPKAIAKKS